ncbi:THAP domain-containing protein 2-like isoform X1 [Oratosquilla oratoria]|uniref:THAP domain-containing protein 2-like isoform X1 n=1 Tax=Oratosquilla oratoria TaxID=337810 RepID=UPI003F75F6EE
MPSHCAVSGCRKTHVKGSEITYHRFPKDEYVRNKWITFCKRTERFNPANSYICSRHFEANAFQRHLKYELLGIPVPTSQKKFKPGAVPTLYYASHVSTAGGEQIVISDASQPAHTRSSNSRASHVSTAGGEQIVISEPWLPIHNIFYAKGKHYNSPH